MLISAAHLVQKDRACKSKHPNQDNIESRRIGPRFQIPKSFSRQNPVAPHPKQQPRGAQSTSQPAAERGNDQNHSHRVKQKNPSHPAADIHKRGLEIRKAAPVRPGPRSKVSLETTDYSGKQTREHYSEQDVALGVLDILRESSNPIKPDISERGERCCRQNAVRIESGGIIKRLGRKQPAPALPAKQKPSGKDNEEHHHNRHEEKQNLVRPRRRPHPRKVQNRHDPRDERRPGDKWHLRHVAFVQRG